jgi:hypothetical protein
MALWPAALCAAKKGRTHGRTNQHCRGAQKTLANGEPSTLAETMMLAFSAIVLQNSPALVISFVHDFCRAVFALPIWGAAASKHRPKA